MHRRLLLLFSFGFGGEAEEGQGVHGWGRGLFRVVICELI